MKKFATMLILILTISQMSLADNQTISLKKELSSHTVPIISTIPTLLYFGTITEATTSPFRSAVTLAATASEFLLMHKLAKMDYFKDGDALGTTLFGTSAFFMSMFLWNGFGDQYDESIRTKLIATTSYLAYLGSKPLMDALNLNLAAICMGTNFQFIISLNANYLNAKQEISDKNYNRLGGFGALGAFALGTTIGKLTNISMNCYSMLSNYSDALALLTHRLPIEGLPKCGLSCLAMTVPYLFINKTEKMLSKFSTENLPLYFKLAELSGIALGIVSMYVLNVDEMQTFIPIAVPTGIVLTTLGLTQLL